MTGRIERFIYNQSIIDRIRNNRIRKKLGVVSFSDVTADKKRIPQENIIDFYEKSLDVLFHHKMEDKIKSIISHAIYNFYTKKNNDIHELQMVEQYLRNMNAKEIAIPNWKAISTFFMSNGMFRIALIAREKYKERLLSTKGRVYSWERVRVYLENENFSKALKGIKKIESSAGMRHAYQIGIATAKRFVQIMLDSKQSLKDSREMEAGDKDFYDMLKGKKIVIEGPAPDIEYPDSDDDVLYIRNNDFFERLERKTDITYLNYDAFKLYTEKYKEYRNKWKYICLKATDKDFQLSEHMRMTSNPTGIFLMGHTHMLPLMLFDLAGEDIYVTGNNLMITTACHNEKYTSKIEIENIEKSSAALCNALANHDAISQYLFLQKLYHSKLFEADRQLTYVMTLGVENYCKKMDEVHGIKSYSIAQ